MFSKQDTIFFNDYTTKNVNDKVKNSKQRKHLEGEILKIVSFRNSPTTNYVKNEPKLSNQLRLFNFI